MMFWSGGIKVIKRKNLITSLCKLALGGAVLYRLWKQQNDPQHGNMVRSKEQILKQINWEIHTRIMGAGSFKKSKENKSICCRWGLYWLV
jgi:hypothetical protein